MMKNVLDIEYRIFDQGTAALLIVRESPDVPGVTEIVMQEKDDRVNHKYGTPVTINDVDLPLLIEALQRRCADTKKEQP